MAAPRKCNCGECKRCTERAAKSAERLAYYHRTKHLHPGKRRRRPAPPAAAAAPVTLTAEMRDALRRAIDARVRKRAGVQ